MTTQIYTPGEYLDRFPRARGSVDALRYVVIEGTPDRRPRADSIATALEEIATLVGYTNHSRRKATYRFAVVPVASSAGASELGNRYAAGAT